MEISAAFFFSTAAVLLVACVIVFTRKYWYYSCFYHRSRMGNKPTCLRFIFIYFLLYRNMFFSPSNSEASSSRGALLCAAYGVYIYVLAMNSIFRNCAVLSCAPAMALAIYSRCSASSQDHNLGYFVGFYFLEKCAFDEGRLFGWAKGGTVQMTRTAAATEREKTSGKWFCFFTRESIRLSVKETYVFLIALHRVYQYQQFCFIPRLRWLEISPIFHVVYSEIFN